MEVQVPLFVSVARWTRTALAEKMRAASNAHRINHLPARAMAKTAQELQAQVLPLRAEQDRLVVQAMVFLLPDFICKQVEFALRR